MKNLKEEANSMLTENELINAKIFLNEAKGPYSMLIAHFKMKVNFGWKVK